MSFSCIRIRKSHRVAWITLTRAESGNVITQTMAQELREACLQVNRDETINAVVITGAGKVFSVGKQLEAKQSRRQRKNNMPCSVAGAVAGIEKPVIAAINGDAAGQGLELALACDIRLAGENARFSFPGIKVGLMPTDGGTQRLPRLVGKAVALEMIFTGDTIDAGEALKIGLVSKIVPVKSLTAEVKTLAESIAAQAPIALRYIKEAINGGLDLTLEQGLRLEADLYYLIHTTVDRTEGIHAFMQKRRPLFKGQ